MQDKEKKKEAVMCGTIIAAFAVVLTLTIHIFSTLTPQEVYAPAGHRGMLVKDFPIETIAYSPCANLSDYSFCTCDTETMEASAVKYLAEHRA